jgi:flagellar transcriptional activator FlhD
VKFHGGVAVNTNKMMAEIRDANLSYLMLAQQMIRSDKATAIFRLGISQEIAELLAGLSNPQLLKLASANMMLARFRFDDSAILGMLTDYNKSRLLAQSHAAILMAGQQVEQIA